MTPRSHLLPENCNSVITVPEGKHILLIAQQTEELRVCLLQVDEDDCFLDLDFFLGFVSLISFEEKFLSVSRVCLNMS